MWRVSIAMCAGCFGVGPTVAVRNDHTVAVGFDADVMVTATDRTAGSLDTGVSVPLSRGETTKYAALQVSHFVPTSGDLSHGEGGWGYTGMFGLANYEDDLMGGVSSQAFSGFSGPPCLQGNVHFLLSLQVGVRWVGTLEWFVMPKVNTEGGSCTDSRVNPSTRATNAR